MENTNETGMSEIVSYLNERAENMVRYSDKLSESITKIDDYIEKIAPKIGIRFNYQEPFFTDTKEHVGKVEYILSIRKDWGLYAVPNCEYLDTIVICRDGSRAMKKAAVKALPAFLKRYAEIAEESEKEYSDISEKAFQIADILGVE